MSFRDILQREVGFRSIPNLLFSGLPAVLAYQIWDGVAYVVRNAANGIFDERSKKKTITQIIMNQTTTSL
jgi:hypothetical protein